MRRTKKWSLPSIRRYLQTTPSDEVERFAAGFLPELAAALPSVVAPEALLSVSDTWQRFSVVPGLELHLHSSVSAEVRSLAQALMAQMGQKTLKVALEDALTSIPEGLAPWHPVLEDDGHTLCYRFDSHAENTGIAGLMRKLDSLGIGYKDLSTEQSSLEDIFVKLVHSGVGEAA